MKITAYKCINTDKIFESISDYRQHRAHYLAKKQQEDDKQAKRDKIKESIDHLRNTATTIEEISEWIVDNGHILALYNNVRPTTDFRITDVKLNLTWYSSCSNSHCAPFDGVQNWDTTKNPHLPVGYPGFRGEIVLKYIGSTNTFFNRIFEDTGINFRNGGGNGGMQYSYHLTLFAADWPGLVEKELEHRVWIELRDGAHNISA